MITRQSSTIPPTGVRALGLWSAAPKRLWPLLASLVVAVGVYRFGLTPFAAVAAAVVASWIAYRFRRLSLAALVLSVLIPSLMHMIQILPEGWDVIAAGVRISDLILVGMLGASAAWMVGRRDMSRAERLFIGASLALAAILLVGVLRNWGAYGLSALGEFRFRYLVLGIPVYLALGFDASRLRLWSAKWLALAPIVGVLIGLPLVVADKGWGLGEAGRFYPSTISLALFLGAVWVALMSREPGRVVPRGMSYAVLAFATVIIVKDAHRSVWLVVGVCLIILLNMGVVEVKRLWLWAAGAAAIGVIAVIGFGSLSGEIIDYIAARGRAFLNPADDPNSYWRLTVWRAYLQPFLQDPLFGQGFGGYWDVYVPELGARIITSPHSMYIQTLVKTGLVGMFALLAWLGVSFRLLIGAGVRQERIAQSRQTVVVLGLLSVAGMFAYGSVYALDFWLLAWIGLALAERFHGEAVEVA